MSVLQWRWPVPVVRVQKGTVLTAQSLLRDGAELVCECQTGNELGNALLFPSGVSMQVL